MKYYQYRASICTNMNFQGFVKMDLDTQKLMVREFYEKYYENLVEMIWFGRREGCALPLDFSPPFERVASVK
jgi:hypothetical protein